jgi:hypothetical protein
MRPGESSKSPEFFVPRIVAISKQITASASRITSRKIASSVRLRTELATPSEQGIKPCISPEQLMPNRIAISIGADPVQREAASDANAVQDACNLAAVVGCFHEHLLGLHRNGVCGDDLINHPVALAFVSKLNSLCRMTLDREMAAFDALDRIRKGEAVAYEVIPL